MKWDEIRQAFPDQWIIVEATAAHTSPDSRRHLDDLAVIEKSSSGGAAFARYRELHRNEPQREYYCIHTSTAEPEIVEREWVGVRPGSNEARSR